MAELSLAELRELLRYDTESGELFWLVNRRAGARMGGRAGTIVHDGYRVITINGRKYSAHRLAWFLAHGAWPRNYIDHINGVRDDNRLNNLRDVSASVNSQNLRGVTRRNVSTGFLGVTQHKLLKKFQSQITCNGKTHYLGLFSSAEAAHSAYLEAKRRLHEGCTI